MESAAYSLSQNLSTNFRTAFEHPSQVNCDIYVPFQDTVRSKYRFQLKMGWYQDECCRTLIFIPNCAWTQINAPHVHIQHKTSALPTSVWLSHMVSVTRLLFGMVHQVDTNVFLSCGEAALSSNFHSILHGISYSHTVHICMYSAPNQCSPHIRLIVIFVFGCLIEALEGLSSWCQFLLGWCISYIFSYTPWSRFWWNGDCNTHNADRIENWDRPHGSGNNKVA